MKRSERCGLRLRERARGASAVVAPALVRLERPGTLRRGRVGASHVGLQFPWLRSREPRALPPRPSDLWLVFGFRLACDFGFRYEARV